VGNDCNVVVPAILQETKLDGPVDQVIPNLIRDDHVFAHSLLRTLEIAHEEMADANKPDFTAIDKLLHCYQDFFNGNCVSVTYGPEVMMTIENRMTRKAGDRVFTIHHADG
jgi:hypothetical protein